MDIVALANAMAFTNTQNAWSMGMLAKSIDQNEVQGAEMTKMLSQSQMELSVNPYVGSNFDVSV